MKYHLCLYLSLALISCTQKSSTANLTIPKHSIFVPSEFDFQAFDKGEYMENRDSILIVTSSKIIIYQGGLATQDEDTVLVPLVVEGGSGFYFRILNNESINPGDKNILWGNRMYNYQPSFSFQWWDYLAEDLNSEIGIHVVGGP